VDYLKANGKDSEKGNDSYELVIFDAIRIG